MRRLLIGGGSMSPTLEIGDVALAVPGGRARCGDVIAFESRQTPLVHRAIVVIPWPRGALIVHKGDRRGAGYGTTRSSAVIGRVVAFERGGERRTLRRRRPRPSEVLAAVSLLIQRTRRRAFA